MYDVYDFSDMSWINPPQKIEMMKFVKKLVEAIKGNIFWVKMLRCDNAGEDMDNLRELCRKEGNGLEYNAPGMPIQNGKTNRNIFLIWKRAMTLVVHDRLRK